MTLRELINIIQGACADMAEGDELLADDLYNDLGWMTDFVGDRIAGEPNRDELIEQLFDLNDPVFQELALKLLD